ncbi:MAG: hypothetical protein ACI4F5_05200 [Acutalibacteraceae bacterium]
MTKVYRGRYNKENEKDIIKRKVVSMENTDLKTDYGEVTGENTYIRFLTKFYRGRYNKENEKDIIKRKVVSMENTDLKTNYGEVTVENPDISFLPKRITDTVKKIAELSEKVEAAERAADAAMKKVDIASHRKTGFFRNSKTIESLQDSQEELAKAQQAAADAQRVTFEFITQLAETTKYLFSLGVTSIATNRTVVRELQLKLEGASKGELNELARQELMGVISDLKAREDMMSKTDNNTKNIKELHKDICNIKTDMGSLENDVDEMEKDIDEAEEDIDEIERSIEVLSSEIDSLKKSNRRKKLLFQDVRIMNISISTIIKTCMLLFSAALGIVNCAGLFVIGKKIKSNFLKIISVILPIVSFFFIAVMENNNDVQSLINTISIFAVMISILMPSVLVIANLKKYILADTLTQQMIDYGIDIDFLDVSSVVEQKPIDWVTPPIKQIAKSLFKDKYYLVLYEIDKNKNNIS